MPEPTIPDISCLRIPELYLLGQEGNHIQQLQGETKDRTEGDGGNTINADSAGGNAEIERQKAAAPDVFTNEEGNQRTSGNELDIDDGITFAWEELDSRNE